MGGPCRAPRGVLWSDPDSEPNSLGTEEDPVGSGSLLDAELVEKLVGLPVRNESVLFG